MVSLHLLLRGDMMPLSGIKASIGRNTYDGAAPTVPVNDVHLRSLNLYDGGSSGVLTYNNGNGRLDLNRNNEAVRPIVTAIVVQIYDADGTGTNVFGGGGTPVIMSTTQVNTHVDLFTLGGAGSEIGVSEDGTYELEWRVTAQDDGGWGRDASISIWLEEDNGGGFTEVAGTRSFASMGIDGNGTVWPATANGFHIMPIFNGYSYRIMVDDLTSGSTGAQVQYGSSFMMKKIY